MLGKVFLPLLAVAALQFAAGAAEEEVMALRGQSPDGRPATNMFRPGPAGGVEEERGGGIGAAQAASIRAGPRGGAEGYLGWKDNCARAPRLVAGKALEMDGGGGFGSAAPITRQDGVNAASHFELLLKELSKGWKLGIPPF